MEQNTDNGCQRCATLRQKALDWAIVIVFGTTVGVLAWLYFTDRIG